MDKVDTYIEFVKDQVAFQKRMLVKYAGDSHRVALHNKSLTMFSELLEALEKTKEIAEHPVPQPRVNARRRVMLSLEDIRGIPDELLSELNLSDTDKQEMMIENIINEAGGVLSLDKILVELYRRTGQIHKRQIVISRLYRMGSRGLIYSLPSKKGLYSTVELSEQDVNRLFGQLDSDNENIGAASA